MSVGFAEVIIRACVHFHVAYGLMERSIRRGDCAAYLSKQVVLVSGIDPGLGGRPALHRVHGQVHKLAGQLQRLRPGLQL